MSAVQMSLRDKMFSFKGRLRRRDYWGISISLGVLVFLLTEALMFALFGPEYCVFTGGLAQAANQRIEDGLPYVIQTLIGCAILWPSLAMAAKRAHDRDKSATLVVVLLVAMWLLSAAQVPLMHNFSDVLTTLPFALGYLVYSLASLALSIYILVVVGCLDGTPGPNRYGPSPKAAELPDAV